LKLKCVKKVIKLLTIKPRRGKTALPNLRTLFRINLRQFVFAILMGTLALSVRNVGLYVIIYPPFRFDPRWVFSLLAACWTGPVGGFFAGGLATLKFPYPQIDLAAIPAHFLVGLVANWLTNNRIKSLYACFAWPLLGVPSYWIATLFFTPTTATIVLVPVLAFIGVSSALLAFAVGLAVEKRAGGLLNFLKSKER
jgi:hypothetical protein